MSRSRLERGRRWIEAGGRRWIEAAAAAKSEADAVKLQFQRAREEDENLEKEKNKDTFSCCYTVVGEQLERGQIGHCKKDWKKNK
jgi:hypothetical protein